MHPGIGHRQCDFSWVFHEVNRGWSEENADEADEAPFFSPTIPQQSWNHT